MDLEIKQIPPDKRQVDDWAKTIHRFITQEPNLSYRSLKEVKKIVVRGEAYGLFKNKRLISFLFLTPLSKVVSELHSAYTIKEERRKGYFSKLLNYINQEQNINILIVTFHEYSSALFVKHGFIENGFKGLPIKAKLAFLLGRIKPWRIKSIINFYKSSQPTYLIKPKK